MYGGTLPVNFATPLNVISSIIVGSDRPFALIANRIILYEFPGSKLSMKNVTGGRCKLEFICNVLCRPLHF